MSAWGAVALIGGGLALTFFAEGILRADVWLRRHGLSFLLAGNRGQALFLTRLFQAVSVCLAVFGVVELAVGV